MEIEQQINDTDLSQALYSESMDVEDVSNTPSTENLLERYMSNKASESTQDSYRNEKPIFVNLRVLVRLLSCGQEHCAFVTNDGKLFSWSQQLV
jgi:hypothetical protein